MVLLVLIALARLVFYSRTFWHAFKALKVPKRRRKIPRPVLNRQTSSHPIQTPPSSDPLNTAQRARRTRLRELTQLCLVWVIWTHSKRFLDWISWAIPFYDELNFAFLIWLIVTGPSAADTVFRYIIHRIVTPYEKSFDSILGTTHDILQITIYLVTCGPKVLRRKWKKWEARQFNKSLSAPTIAPPTKLHVPASYHPQPQKFKHDTSSASASARSNPSRAVSTQAASSFYLTVPERKPILSRKLSDGYRRSVSNSKPKALLYETAPYNTRSVSTHRAIYPLRCGSTSAFLPTNSINSNRNRPCVFSEVSDLKLSSQENMSQLNHGPKENRDKDEENNSIIIHDDSLSIHEADLLPTRSTNGPPVKTTRQKRVRNVNDDDVLAFRQAKKALRAHSVKRVAKVNMSNTEKTSLQASDATPAPLLPMSAQDGPSLQSPLGQPRPITNSCVKDSQEYTSSGHPSSNSACTSADVHFPINEPSAPMVQRRLHNSNEPLPPPDPRCSEHGTSKLLDLSADQHQKIPQTCISADMHLSINEASAPMVPRRLHNSDEPLPPPDSRSNLLDLSVDQHHEIRQQALNSVRSLTSTSDFPSPNRTTGWLAHRLPNSIIAINNGTPSASESTTKTIQERLLRSLDGHKTRKVSSSHLTTHDNGPSRLVRKREISGKLGQQKVLLAAKKSHLQASSARTPPSTLKNGPAGSLRKSITHTAVDSTHSTHDHDPPHP